MIDVVYYRFSVSDLGTLKLLGVGQRLKAAAEPADAAALSCTESGGVFVHPTGRQFQCDHLLRGDQEEVWEHVGEPLVAAALRGHSATVLAVGPTGGGRTYTLHGTADEPGLAPRALRALFAAAAEDDDVRDAVNVVCSVMITKYNRKNARNTHTRLKTTNKRRKT